MRTRRSQRGFWQYAIPAAAALTSRLLNDRSAEKSAHINADLQREFAQNGIQWRVADAKKAGIHPVYAMGGGGVSASPVAVGSQDSSISDFGSMMGQDLSRAEAAAQSAEDRMAAARSGFRAMEYASPSQSKMDSLNLQIREEQLVSARLENLRRNRELAGMDEDARLRMVRNAQQLGPPMPTGPSYPGGGGREKLEPSKRTSHDPTFPGREASPTPLFKTVISGGGSKFDVLNPDYADADNPLAWFPIGAAMVNHYWDKWFGRDLPEWTREKKQQFKDWYPGYRKSLGQ